MHKFLTRLLTLMLFLPLISWMVWYRRGAQFARRDRLRHADAIVVLAGARGKMAFLDGKIQTAAHLYRQGWAPAIICSGRFSIALTATPKLIPQTELQMAVTQGRIQQKDVATAAKKWDEGLGATYMRDQLVHLGIPEQHILLENQSLHTRENAEYVFELMKQQGMHRIILVTSPFHQLRTFLTFAKVFQPAGFEIMNHYADTGEWHPLTWFFSRENRKLVKSEQERILLYRRKGDLL